MALDRDYERNRHISANDLDEPTRPGRASRSAGLTPSSSPSSSGIVMRKGDGDIAEGAESAVASATSSTGQALPGELQGRFEESLGTDLSSVRVHTGDSSAQAAGAVSARAYAVGNDIHFGAGQYDPGSSSGQTLIAHEVAHTVQQRGSGPAPQYKLEVSTSGDSHEVEADRAADAMVRGAPASVSAGGIQISRNPLNGATPPPPPGMVTLKNLGPTASAVAAGESGGGGAIPSPAGLYDVAEGNFSRNAQHCINVQAYYAAKAASAIIGKDTFQEGFAKTCGDANKYCATGSVLANSASTAIAGCVPLLQASQDDWKAVKDAAGKAGIDMVNKEGGGTALDSEGVTEEGTQLKGKNAMVSPKKVDDLGPDATAKQKADNKRQKESSDQDIADGKNVKSESKVLLDEASTNFEQSVAAVTGARRGVVSSAGSARKKLLDARLKANAKRQSAAEDEKKGIDDILALVDKAQSAIEKGRSIVETGDDIGGMKKDVEGSISGIKASQVATLVLTLDGTIPSIVGEIQACKSADGNLKDLIDDGAIQSAGKDFGDKLTAFKDALKLLPERAKKFENAHNAYAESVNQALMKRGMLKKGEDGVKPMMELLAKVRIASASTTAAIEAAGDAKASISELNELGAPPSPDLCQLANMATAHGRAFNTAPGHMGSILGVLKARQAELKSVVSKIGI